MKKNLSSLGSDIEHREKTELLKTEDEAELICGLMEGKEVEFEYDYFQGQGTYIIFKEDAAKIEENNHEYQIGRNDKNEYNSSLVNFVLSAWKISDELRELAPKIPPGNLEHTFGGIKKLAQDFWNVKMARGYAKSPIWADKDKK